MSKSTDSTHSYSRRKHMSTFRMSMSMSMSMLLIAAMVMLPLTAHVHQLTSSRKASARREVLHRHAAHQH
jgi:hypothetical protein